MSDRKLKHQSGFMLVLALPVFAVLLWAVKIGSYDVALQEQSTASKQQLKLYATHIEGVLAKYETIPSLLSTNQRVIKVLIQAQNYSARQALNEYFEHSAKASGALDIYLMDVTGLTVAASNWHKENTFIGRNFHYRPYFQQAMQGKLGRYYALGSTSRVRGYYFAYPVERLGKVIGAVVVKMDVGALEKRWEGAQETVIVTDPDGVVFISTDERWRYTHMQPLSEETRERLVQSGRYLDIEHEAMPLFKVQDYADQQQLVELDIAGQKQPLLQLDYAMPDAGWSLHLLVSLKEVERYVWASLLIASGGFTVLFLLSMIVMQRKMRAAEQAHINRESRKALEKAHQQLEYRVEERTADLRHEIEEHQRTEDALHKAQDELVQAAKLATLGQMSASINHELNQPLTAIRGYADNARLLLERGRFAEVKSNLLEITKLVDRMANISSQLKLFARKSSGQLVPTNVANALQVGAKILHTELEKSAVKVHFDRSLNTTYVLSDTTRLEQVFLNLMGNAVQALSDVAQPYITIKAHPRPEGRVHITVRDNGPGIPQADLEHIFDPFFTTRKSGLGLGLAISQHIVQTMNGELFAANNLQGGAEFTVVLDRAP
jgi:two-component system C4-dicarboxylate transport sensor histidine kinase DctB